MCNMYMGVGLLCVDTVIAQLYFQHILLVDFTLMTP